MAATKEETKAISEDFCAMDEEQSKKRVDWKAIRRDWERRQRDLENGSKPFLDDLSRESQDSIEGKTGNRELVDTILGIFDKTKCEGTTMAASAMRWNCFKSCVSIVFLEEKKETYGHRTTSKLNCKCRLEDVGLNLFVRTGVSFTNGASVLVKALAWEKLCAGMFVVFHYGEQQVEVENIGGTREGNSDQKGEAIITTAEADVVSAPIAVDETLLSVCATESTSVYDVTKRWMALPNFTVSTASGTAVPVWEKKLPCDLYSENASSINLMPIKNHIYFTGNIKMKFVPNGPQFGAGRLVASVLADPAGTWPNQWNQMTNALTRQHVLIDLSSNNAVTIDIPYQYRRPLSRVQYSQRKAYPVRPAFWAVIQVFVESPYRAATGQPTSVSITPWYSFEGFKFAGETWSKEDCAPVGQVGPDDYEILVLNCFNIHLDAAIELSLTLDCDVYIASDGYFDGDGVELDMTEPHSGVIYRKKNNKIALLHQALQRSWVGNPGWISTIMQVIDKIGYTERVAVDSKGILVERAPILQGVQQIEEGEQQGLFGLVQDTAHGVGNIVKEVESLATRFGAAVNCDKPVDYRVASFRPNATGPFCHGRGPNLAQSMCFNLDATDTILPDHIRKGTPSNVMDIARIWGLKKRVQWSNTHTAGTVLATIVPNLIVDPNAQSTPCEYIAALYQGWSGPITYRFDFVCNKFHQGAVVVAVSFGADNDKYLEEMSTYCKTLHVSDSQKSFEVTVPYIYDTKFRRSGNAMYMPISSSEYPDTAAVRMQMTTTLRITVLNPLIPIANAPNDIEIMVYMRVGEGFAFHRPVGGGHRIGSYENTIYPFPRGFLHSVTAVNRDKRAVSRGEHDTLEKGKPDKRSAKNETSTAAAVTEATSTTTTVRSEESTLAPVTEASGSRRRRTALPSAEELKYERDVAKYPWIQTRRMPVPPANMRQYRAHLDEFARRYFDSYWPSFMAEEQINVEAESIDSTNDFNHGTKFSRRVVSSEQTYDVKDLLRTPVLVHWYLKCTGWLPTSGVATGYGNFWIPVIPPSGSEVVSTWDEKGMSSTEQDSQYSQTPHIGESRQANILAMYGQWRGNTVYNIFVYGMSDRDMPIYVVHVPHDGSFKFGGPKYHTVNGEVSNSNVFNLTTTGLMYKVIIPSVNPSITIDVPHTNENEWCIMHSRGWNAYYNYRDKGGMNNGHIVLMSAQDFRFDIHWEAGDQFLVSAFNGIPNTLASAASILASDAGPSTDYDKTLAAEGQMTSEDEFFDTVGVVEEKSSTVLSKIAKEGNSILKIVKDNPVKTALAAVAPGLATAMTMHTASEKIQDEVSNFSGRAGKTLSKLDDVADEASVTMQNSRVLINSLTHTVDNVNATIVDLRASITASLQSVVENLLGATCNVVEYVNDLVVICLAGELKTTLFSMFRIIGRMGLISLEKVSEVAWSAWDAVKTALGPRQQTEGSSLSLSDTEAGSLVGIIVGIVASFVGGISNSKVLSVTGVLSSMLAVKSLSMISLCVNVCKNGFTVLKKCFDWFLKDAVPVTELARYFDGNHESVRQYYQWSVYVMDPLNGRYKTTTFFRRKAFHVWATTVRLQELAFSKRADFPIAFVRYLEKVRTWCEENMKSMAESPIKYTPIGIYISGPAGIGKSEFLSHVTEEWCKKNKIGVTGATKAFVRSTGSQYVEGYNGQPVWLYDDFAQVGGEIGLTCFNEVIQLGSPARFIPNRARLENKDESVSPLIIGAASNVLWPKHNDIVNHQAIWRRFQIKLEIEKVSEPTQKMDFDFKHARFYVYRTYNSENDRRSGPFTGAEVKEWVYKQFDHHFKIESKKVAVKLEEIRKQLTVDATDPLEVVYRAGLREISPEDGAMDLILSDLMRVPQIMPRYVPADPIAQHDTGDEYFDNGGLLAYTGSILVGFGSWCNFQLGKYKFTGNMQVDGAHAVAETCSVCFADKPWVAACRHNGTFVHHTCATCYVQMLRIDPEVHCPICRNPEYNLKLDAKLIQFLTMKEKTINFGIEVVRHLFKYLGHTMEVIGYIQLVMWAISKGPMIVMGSIVVSVIYRILGRFLGIGLPRFIYQAYEMLMMDPMSMVAQQQIIDFDVISEPIEEVEEPTELSADDGRMRAIHLYHTTKVPALCTEECKHPASSVNLGLVLYIDQKFKWNVDGVEYECSPYACLKGRNCPWEDYRTFRDFHLAFLGERTSMYHVPPGLSGMTPVEVDEGVMVAVTKPWYEYTMDHIREFFNRYGKLLMGLGITAVAGWGVWSVCQWLTTGAVEQIVSSGDAVTARQAVRTNITATRTFAGGPVAQVGYSDVRQQDLMTAIKDRVIRNTIVIRCYATNSIGKSMLALGVKGTFVAINRHYIPYIKAAIRIEVFRWTNPELVKVVRYDPAAVVESESVDLAIWRLEDVNMFVDLTKYMPRFSENLPYLPSVGWFLDIDARKKPTVGACTTVQIQVKGWESSEGVRYVEGMPNTSGESITYKYERSGACGNVLLIDTIKPLVALHHAGSPRSGLGFGVPLWSDEITKAINQLSEVAAWTGSIDEAERLIPQIEDETALPTLAISDEFNMAYEAIVAKEYTPFVSDKTSIIESPISRFLKTTPQTFPAILGTKDPRFQAHWLSPLTAGFKKHGKTWMSPTTARTSHVYEALKQEYLNMQPLVAKPRMLTWDEAAMGLDGFEEYPKLRTDTSSGWPWSEINADKSKRWAIDYQYDSACPSKIVGVKFDDMFILHVKDAWSARSRGQMQYTVFQEFLKDERRKMSKISKEGGTRLIDGAPMDYTLAKRRLYGHVTAAYLKAGFNMYHAIGINKAGPQWAELVRHLHGVGTNILALDFTDFGPSIPAAWIRVLGRLRFDWLVHNGVLRGDACDWALNTCITEEICCAKYIAGNCIASGIGGSPSGDVGTAEQNSMYNVMILLDAWFVITGRSYDEFKKYVRLVVYGDDVIMSVHDDVLEEFNTNTISDYLEYDDIICTDESKSTNAPKSRAITEVSFLKSAFVPHPIRMGMWLAPMPEPVIDDIVHYIRKCVNVEKAVIDNVKCALEFWYHHGRKKFQSKLTEYNNALNEVGYDRVSMTWHEVDDRNFDSGKGLHSCYIFDNLFD